MTLEELEVFVTTQANVSMEAYYWWCTALMIAIHVGFLMYEVGASRFKNAVSSAVKNLLAFAFMIPTFWLFGWYIYLAFPGGFTPIDLEGYGTPWNVSMGPMLSDQATGIFWAAFTLFACTTASVFSGAVLDTNVIDVNEPPIFMVHDDQDPTVAYGTGFASALGFPIVTVEGSSIMAIRGTNVGLNNELITIPNSANHVSYLKAGSSVWEDSIFNASTKFLNNIICPLQPQNISEKESKNTISLYPNPTTGFINIDLGKVIIKTVQLSGVDGRIIFKDASINSSKYRFNIDGNSGLYVVEITTQNTKENFQIIKK